MTDKQVIIEMFDRAGIVYEDRENSGTDPETGDPYTGSMLASEQGEGEKNLGYIGFVAVLYFTTDGNLDAIGAWE